MAEYGKFLFFFLPEPELYVDYIMIGCGYYWILLSGQWREEMGDTFWPGQLNTNEG